jgi:hypothetical protein
VVKAIIKVFRPLTVIFIYFIILSSIVDEFRIVNTDDPITRGNIEI